MKDFAKSSSWTAEEKSTNIRLLPIRTKEETSGRESGNQRIITILAGLIEKRRGTFM